MFCDMIIAAAGEGRYKVEASAQFLGNDISVCVVGGTQFHIGAVSMAVYEPVRDSATVSTISVHTHRDDVIASQFSKSISREMKCTVCVSAGLHIDEADEDVIRVLRGNAAECCCSLITKLKKAEEI